MWDVTKEAEGPRLVLAIPTLKFRYGNLLLARLRELGSASIGELLGEDPAQLFKCDGPFDDTERRARDCLRFARMLDLVVGGRPQVQADRVGYHLRRERPSKQTLGCR